MAVTLRVILARWGLYVLAMLPGLFAMSRHLDEAVGKRPFFHDVQLPLDTLSLGLLMSELAGGGMLVLMCGVFFIWLMQLLWLAGATRVLDPALSPAPRKVFASGRPFLGRLIRIAIFALLGAIAVHLAIRYFHNALSTHAELQVWTVQQSFFSLTLWRAAALFAGLTLVGTFAFWARVIAVADDRRYLRRLPRMVLRLFLQRPVSALLLQFAAISTILVVQGAALLFWRQSSSDGAFWLLLWTLLLLLASWIWQLRIRLAIAVWRADDMQPLRQVEDRPWRYWWRREKRRTSEQTDA